MISPSVLEMKFTVSHVLGEVLYLWALTPAHKFNSMKSSPLPQIKGRRVHLCYWYGMWRKDDTNVWNMYQITHVNMDFSSQVGICFNYLYGHQETFLHIIINIQEQLAATLGPELPHQCGKKFLSSVMTMKNMGLRKGDSPTVSRVINWFCLGWFHNSHWRGLLLHSYSQNYKASCIKSPWRQQLKFRLQLEHYCHHLAHVAL